MTERIKELRKALNLSQDEFANSLGLKTRGKIANIELGRVVPDGAFLSLICKTHNVNYQWLISGEGDMLREDDGDAQAIVDSVMNGGNEFAKKMLVRFASLGEDRWRQLKEIMEQMMQE